MDEVLRLRKDRSNIQILVDDVRDKIGALQVQHDSCLEEIFKIQKWNVKMKEILGLSTLIEIQEEQDKTSINLTGYRETVGVKDGGSHHEKS